MPPYNEKDPSQIGQFKFIKFGDLLHVEPPGPYHKDSAAGEGILDGFNRVRLEDPTGVDAGTIIITAGSVHVLGGASSLGIDEIVPEARARTIGVFEAQSPSRVVKKI